MGEHYTHGEMDISDQSSTWSAFVKLTQWGSLITALILAYAIFTITMGMNWMVALGLLAAVGIGAGFMMRMGAAWITTVIGLVVLGVFVHLIILFASAVI